MKLAERGGVPNPMIPARQLLVAALAATTVGLGALAYSEHSARVAAEELNQSLQDKMARLAKAKAAPVQLAPALPQATFPAGVTAPADEPAEGAVAIAARAAGSMPNMRAAAAEFIGMMDTPEMQQLMNLRSRGALDGRYAALFKQLGLPPDQLQKFQQLLLDKQSTMRDVITAMRSQGLTPGPDTRDQMRTLVQNANAEIDTQIEATLGPAGYAQYQTYEQTQPQRTTVERVQQRLSYSSQPLTDQQAASLVSIMAQEAQARANANGNGGNGGGPRRGFAGGGNGAAITDQVIQQASAVLSPAQLTTLQEVQQEQQAQAALGRRARETFTGARPGGGGAPAPAPAGK
jgi:hypothetical protein